MAEKRVTSYTPESAPAGSSVLGTASGAVKLFLISSLASVISFVAGGAGAGTRTLLAKLRDIPSVLDYVQPADGSNITPAMVRAADHHRVILFPPNGSYTMSTPFDVNSYEGLVITTMGKTWGSTNTNSMPKITANAGFITNSSVQAGSTRRRRIFVSGVDVSGNETAVGILGAMGGRFENMRISGYTDIVQNPSAFLLRFVRVSFFNANIGLNVADFNGSKVEDCFFDTTVQLPMTTQTVTPHTGSSNGFPYVIRGNNINVSSSDGISNKVSFDLRAGLFKFVDNYWEDYSPAGSYNNTCLNVTVGRFDNGSFEISGNEINGQGLGTTGIRLIANNTLGARGNGVITRNRLLGHTNPIIYGHPVTANLNLITDVKVYDNNVNTITGMNVQGRYAPRYSGSRVTNLTVSGETWTTVPINTVLEFDNAGQVSGNGCRIRKPGIYEYVMTATLETTALDYATAAVKLMDAGVTIKEVVVPLTFAKTPVRQITVAGMVEITSISPVRDIVMQARRGETLTHAQLTMKWLGDGNQ